MTQLDRAEHHTLVEVLLQERIEHKQRQGRDDDDAELDLIGGLLLRSRVDIGSSTCATNSNCCNTTCNGCFVSSVM